MRYQDWDILLFSDTSKVPIQEFKTTCHVIQDSEYLPTQGALPLVPTVTSFVPALPKGQTFRLSIHSWEEPEPSRFALNFTKDPSQIMFEARVFIDGRLAGFRYFDRESPWPTLIGTGITVNKNGELEPLRFPAFHQEILTQNYWNAGDDLGRIKIVIAEGLRRNSATTAFDRIKNVVAFSFQHAPLEVLESSGIAWPNAEMWRHISFVTGMVPGGNVPRKFSGSGNEVHSHSPRRRSVVCPQPQPQVAGMMLPPGLPTFPRPAHFDSFTEPQASHWRQPSSADVSMPDYSCSVSQASHSRQFTDPTSSNKMEQRFQSLESVGAFEGLCEALKPTSTTRRSHSIDEDSAKVVQSKAAKASDDAQSVRNLAGQTTPVTTLDRGISGSVKSKKENAQETPVSKEAVADGNNFARNVSQPSSVRSAAGHKRQRVVTPASVKAIDQEDEPKTSMMRKISQGSVGRRPLGELPNVL